MPIQTDLVIIEKITSYETRVWFSLNVISFDDENVRDFRGTETILDYPNNEPLSVKAALCVLQEEFYNSSRGALMLLTNEIEYGFLRLLVNPTIPTYNSAETMLNDAARKTADVLKEYTI